MRYLSFILFVYLLSALAYAGPNDRWVPVESIEDGENVGIQPAESTGQLDGVALLLAIGAFAWVYIIYRDYKGKSKK